MTLHRNEPNEDAIKVVKNPKTSRNRQHDFIDTSPGAHCSTVESGTIPFITNNFPDL